jgi:hypothetical protein
MDLLRKTVISVGALATAAALLSLASTKTAHAYTEEPVIILNPVIHPAIVEEVPHFASHLVLLCSNTLQSNTVPQFFQFSPGGGCYQATAPYPVPAGQSLVITAIDIFDGNDTYLTTQVEILGPTGAYGVWKVQGSASSEFQYPSGIVVPSGTTLSLNLNGSNEPIQVILHGYLTTE